MYTYIDANLVITWSRNPQSRLRSDPGTSIACENKTNLGGFQVQNVFFLDCPTMIAMDDFKFGFKFICCSDHKQHQFLHLFAYQPNFE
jgi:hypothetical protein